MFGVFARGARRSGKFPTSARQLTGYRFLQRRTQHSLALADSRMIHDPLKRSQRALGVSAVFACMLLAAVFVISVFSPATSLNTSGIVMSKSSASLLVSTDQGWREVPNLASARLVVGSAAHPVVVQQELIDQQPHAAPIGIPSAPHIPHPVETDGKEMQWNICDVTTGDSSQQVPTDTILVGQRVDTSAHRAHYFAHHPEDFHAMPHPLDAQDSEKPPAFIAVHGDRHWVITAAGRSAIDVSDQALMNMTNASALPRRVVSSSFLALIPQRADMTWPRVNPTTEVSSYSPAPDQLFLGHLVRTEENQWFLIHRDGLQPVSELQGKMMQFQRQDSLTVTTLRREDIAAIARLRQHDFLGFPSVGFSAATSVSHEVMCSQWSAPLTVDGTVTATSTGVWFGGEVPNGTSGHRVDTSMSDLQRIWIGHSSVLCAVVPQVEGGSARDTSVGILDEFGGFSYIATHQDQQALGVDLMPRHPLPASLHALFITRATLSSTLALEEISA